MTFIHYYYHYFLFFFFLFILTNWKGQAGASLNRRPCEIAATLDAPVIRQSGLPLRLLNQSAILFPCAAENQSNQIRAFPARGGAGSGEGRGEEEGKGGWGWNLSVRLAWLSFQI